MSLQPSMVPLFHLADTVATIKGEEEQTLEKFGAVVVFRDDAAAHFLGWGQDCVQAVLRPLVSGPMVVCNIDRANALFEFNEGESQKHINYVGFSLTLCTTTF